MAGKPHIESNRASEGQEELAGLEDLLELARVVTARIAELGLTRKEVERRSGVSVATIRRIEHPTGPRKFGHKVLEGLSKGLGWPPGHLVRIAYPSSSEAPDRTVQAMMTALAPYLKKIDAIPGLQADVAAIRSGLGIKVDIIHEVGDFEGLASRPDVAGTEREGQRRDESENDADRPSGD